MRNQEMDIKECGEVLLSRVRKFEPWIAKEIVHQILSKDTPLQNRQYASDSDEKILSLIDEAKKCMKPKARSPGREFPIPSWKSQDQPSSSSDGIQAPIPPAGQREPSQIPVDKCIGLEERLQSSSIPDDGMPGCSNVIGCPPSSSEPWPKPCHSYISTGVCKKALQNLPCGFSHGLGSLGVIEMEIRLILMKLGAVPVACLQAIYFEWYWKPLQAMGWHGNPGSLTSLLLRLHTTRLITNSYEELHIVLLEHAPAYLGNFADSCNAVDAGSAAHQIYITFSPESRFRFTEQDVHNYFSLWGPVSSVRIPRQRSFGFVSFWHPETVRLLLSEWNPRVPHFIGMSSPDLQARVFVKRYKEEAKRRNSAEKHALKNGCDPGLVTEKSNVTIAPEMAPPQTHYPPSHSQRESNSLEDKNVTRSQHVSDDPDEDSAHQHIDDVLASLPDINCFYEAT